ncbi:hypothetical protein IFR05_015439 [Cadophora sp. M221]|nr:hypothetical protein IFR05_015439 [Cadophora sp. M221]
MSVAPQNDPFSIISVVVIALKAIHTTKDYVETICRAPRSVSALAIELADIESLLRQLGQIAQDERADDSEMHQILYRPLANCETAVNELRTLTDPLVSRKTGRGVRRIQHHLGIETSSVASEDIHGRTFEHIERWNLETETIVEEDTELSSSTIPQQASSHVAPPLTNSPASSIDYIPPRPPPDHPINHNASSSILQQAPSYSAPPKPPESYPISYHIAPLRTDSSDSSIDYIPPRSFQDHSKNHISASSSIPQQAPLYGAPPEPPQTYPIKYNIARLRTNSPDSSIDYIPPRPLQGHLIKQSTPSPPVIPPKEQARAAENAKQELRLTAFRNWFKQSPPKKAEPRKQSSPKKAGSKKQSLPFLFTSSEPQLPPAPPPTRSSSPSPPPPPLAKQETRHTHPS